MKKVFIIGFNRTATKAIHTLFKKSGYNSAHYSLRDMTTGDSIIIAQQMKKNLEEYKPILYGMEHIQVFSDMFWHRDDEWIDGNKYYKELYNQYPDSLFVINTRPKDTWLESKRTHKDGAYIQRCMKYHNLNEEEMLEWFAKDRQQTEEEMQLFFYKQSKVCTIFNVEREDISKLTYFLKPHFFLREKDWVHV